MSAYSIGDRVISKYLDWHGIAVGVITEVHDDGGSYAVSSETGDITVLVPERGIIRYRSRVDEGHALMTDAEADALADWFNDLVDNAPKTFGPISRDLAREAAFGYSVEAELREAGPEPSDGMTCPDCGAVLRDCDTWSISGTQWNGCDVDETCFSCDACGTQGVL